MSTLILHLFLNICLFQISNGLPHTDVYVDIFQSVDSLILLRMSFQEGVRFVLDLFMRYPDGTAPPRKEGNIKIMDYFFEYVGKVRSQSLVEISKKTNTPSVRKYLSSKWIKGNVSRRILVLDTSLFIHFDDKYFRTEGVENRVGDDGVRAILQYRPSDLYLTDRKETMAILQKYTHTSLHVRK